jgi:transcription antitermination factor NusG
VLKLTDNPPIKPERLARLADARGTWFVGHTKARSEKAFAWDLLHLGIDYFLPMVTKVTFSGGRKRRGLTPLFPSYVFFNGDREARARAFATDRICNAIEVTDVDRFVGEVSAIELALDHEQTIDIFPFAVVGRRVRVTAGPLAGVVGTIVRRDTVHHLVIEVRMLSQAAAMPIDAGLVEPWDD